MGDRWSPFKIQNLEFKISHNPFSPVSTGGINPDLATVGGAKSTNNQWFLVGSAAAELKSPEASDRDDTARK